MLKSWVIIGFQVVTIWISDFLSGIQAMACKPEKKSAIQMPNNSLLFKPWSEKQTFYRTKSLLFRCPITVCYSSNGLNIGPFNNRTVFNHLNTVLVRYSDLTVVCTWESQICACLAVTFHSMDQPHYFSSYFTSAFLHHNSEKPVWKNFLH